jgi:beta-lactamase class A
MHIVVQQLEGQKWYAAAREHESIPSGSTYKLFVAMVLFDRINKGQIHWSDPMLDTTVSECFDRMTVASTNPCAESWIAQFGREYINNFAYARGFSHGTSFTTGSATQTTAADLNKYMIGLDNGTLVTGANRSKLLYNLSRHPYKYGIATGSIVASDKVYDKVGFLWDYIHDTAIVSHPKGKYILTIMTKGQSYAAIANVTREIERIMYP